LLRLVGLEPRFARRYPHEFPAASASVSRLRGRSREPKLIICDEPVFRTRRLDPLTNPQFAARPAGPARLAYIFVSHRSAV